MRILLIEDDEETAEFVVRGLAAHDHVLDHAATGHAALAKAVGVEHDLLIVDRMLPDVDGLSVVRTLRAQGSSVPVLFLSTMGGIDDRVEGLDAGGDDYLTKPFALAELAARVHALGRRPYGMEARTVLEVGDLRLDRLRRTATRGGTAIELQPREFELLDYLMRHAGSVVTKAMLLEHVWDFHFDPRTTVVETHISRLRAKIDRGFAVELLQTVRGEGYCLRAPTPP
jgi:two-component system OmpR family response regulator